jgi:hypothetical protein
MRDLDSEFFEKNCRNKVKDLLATRERESVFLFLLLRSTLSQLSEFIRIGDLYEIRSRSLAISISRARGGGRAGLITDDANVNVNFLAYDLSVFIGFVGLGLSERSSHR